MNQKEINRLLEGLFDNGFIFEKKVGKVTNSAGAIYLPKRLIGKSFRVILVPMKEDLKEDLGEESTDSNEKDTYDMKFKEKKETFPEPVMKNISRVEILPKEKGRLKINVGLKENPEFAENSYDN